MFFNQNHYKAFSSLTVKNINSRKYQKNEKHIGGNMETINESISYARNGKIQEAISIQSKAISLLWGLENSFLAKEEREKKINPAYNKELKERKLRNASMNSVESENHLSLHSNHLEIDSYLEITDFVRSKALKQEKVHAISQNNSQMSLSMMAASLLQ